MNTIWVDFNDIVNGMTTTLTKYASEPVYLGQTVRCEDEDGMLMYGQIIGMRNDGLLTIQLDLSTVKELGSGDCGES